MPTQESQKVVLPQAVNFLFSSTAPMMAAVFTNPFDVAKVRVQLQGELARGKAVTRVYSGSFDCMYKTLQHEGIRGLQRGLTPALWREGSKNFFRLGLYDPIIQLIHDKREGVAPIWKRMIAGAISGAAGALSCNPFEIVKTRIQAQASSAIATGHQHNYSGVFSAFKLVIEKEGVRGLYKGSSVSMLRSTIATSLNLTVYTKLKEMVFKNPNISDSPLVDAACSLVSAFATALVSNPVDVVRTRLYNQPFGPDGKGLLYKNGVDAAVKIVTKEGPKAFMKGFTSAFMRLGPHFVLTFVFLEQMNRTTRNIVYERTLEKETRQAFDYFDRDKDGKLSRRELLFAFSHSLPRQVFPSVMDKQAFESKMQESVNSLLLRADLDHDDSISYEEYLKVSQELRQLMQRHELLQLFDAIDTNNDGVLDFEELVAAFKATIPRQQRDRHLLPEQYEARLRQDLEKMMRYADIDNSGGGISFDEFVSVATGLSDVQATRVMQVWMRNAGVAAP
eukprot:Colp12_sorted_trinity150504_noHs@17549